MVDIDFGVGSWERLATLVGDGIAPFGYQEYYFVILRFSIGFSSWLPDFTPDPDELVITLSSAECVV